MNYDKDKPGPPVWVEKDGQTMQCMTYYLPQVKSRGWKECSKPIETPIVIDREHSLPSDASVEIVAEDDGITIREAAELIGKKPSTIRGYINSGKIKNIGVALAPKVSRSEVEAL